MSKKAFSIYRITIVSALTIAVSLSIVYGNWYVPVASLIGTWVLLYILRRKISEVVADERDLRIAGKAAGLALRAYVLVSLILGLILYIGKAQDPAMFLLGSAFLYSACFFMLLYAVLFKIYEKKDENA